MVFILSPLWPDDGDLEGDAIFNWTVNNINQAPTADNDDYDVDQGDTLNL